MPPVTPREIDHVIHGHRVVGHLAGTAHLGIEHNAPIGLEAAAQHRRQRVAHLIERDVSHETEPAVVDADQRNPERCQLARHTEHRAVAAQHDRDVGFLADCVHRMRIELVESQVLGGGVLEQHAPAGGLHDAGDRQQRLANAFRAGLAEEGDVPEGLGHASIMQDAVMAARPSGAASGLS